MEKLKDKRLERRAKDGKTPYHKFTIKIYRPISPSMAKWLVESWCKFYTQDIAFGISEYSICYEE